MLKKIEKVWEQVSPANIKKQTRRLEKSPKALWEEACDYFRFVDQNPFLKQELIKGGEAAGGLRDVRQNRPYTVQGCEIFLRIKPNSLSMWSKSSNEDLADVAQTIKHVIDNDKLEGAIAGIFVPSIVVRDLGLTDKVETTEKKYRVTLKKADD